MNNNSHTLTGRTVLKPGNYYLLTNRDEVHLTHLSNEMPAKMGVHPRTRETVLHPITNGKVIYECTLFNEHFNPDNYPYITVTQPGE